MICEKTSLPVYMGHVPLRYRRSMANLDSQIQVGDRHKFEITLIQHRVIRQSCTNVGTLVMSNINKVVTSTNS